MTPAIDRPKLKRKPAAQLTGVALDPRRGDPLHLQLRRQLRGKIEADYSDGDFFYTEEELVRELCVSRVTVRRALDDLRQEGLLKRQAGRGTIIVKGAEAQRLAGENGLRPVEKTSESPSGAKRAAITTIGLIASSFRSDYGSAIVDMFSDVCAAQGLSHHILFLSSGTSIDEALARVPLCSDEMAFVTFVPSDRTLAAFSALSERGFRSIAVDGLPGGYHGPAVTTDARAAVRLGLEHLWSLGHERIALLVNEPMRDASVTDKLDEFSIAMRRRGLAASARMVLCGTQYGESSHDAAYAHMGEVWTGDARQRPTAVFAVSDPGAWAAMRWLAEQGVSVPGDVSVLGFEDARTSAHVTPPLTTIAHPLRSVASRAISLLVGGEPLAHVREYVAPELVVRQSTGRALIGTGAELSYSNQEQTK